LRALAFLCLGKSTEVIKISSLKTQILYFTLSQRLVPNECQRTSKSIIMIIATSSRGIVKILVSSSLPTQKA